MSGRVDLYAKAMPCPSVASYTATTTTDTTSTSDEKGRGSMSERMIDREKGFFHVLDPNKVYGIEGPMIDLDPEKQKANQERIQEAECLIKWALNWTSKKAFAKDKNLDVWRERSILWTEGK